MKPINVIYGIAGILTALVGGGIVLMCLSILAVPHLGTPWGVCVFGLGGAYLFWRGMLSVRYNFDSRYRSGGADESISERSIEDRLDELERLKRRDMVTTEEYAAKRQEILKDL